MRVEQFIEIDAPVESVFAFFSNFEEAPRWMRNIREVRGIDRRVTRWTADAPFVREIEWDVEMTVCQPDHRIVWRSMGGDVVTDGEAIFEETRRATTMLHVVIGYYPTGGAAGPAVARLFGRNAQQQLEEDLEEFRRLAERRATVRGRARYEDRNQPRFAPRASRFNAESRDDDRRGRIESTNRYREEHARDEEDHRRRQGFEGAYGSPGAEERIDRRRGERSFHGREEDEYPPQRNYGPRGSDAQRPEREPERDASHDLLRRRGVDRLLDDAPRDRWRRRR